MVHGVIAGGGYNRISFFGDDAQSLMQIMHALQEAFNPYQRSCSRVCKGKQYTHEGNAAAIARLNGQTKGLFGVCLNGIVQEMALTPHVPVYYAFLWYFEKLATQILFKENSFKVGDEHTQLFSFAITALKVVMAELSEAAMKINAKREDTAEQAHQSVRDTLKECLKGLESALISAQGLKTSITLTVSKETKRPEYTERFINNRTYSLNKYIEGIKHMQLLFQSKEDWILLLQPCSQVMDAKALPTALDVKAAFEHLIAIADHLLFGLAEHNFKQALNLLNLPSRIKAHLLAALKEYSDKLEDFKRFVNTAQKQKKGGLDSVPKLEEFFRQTFPPFLQLAQQLTGENLQGKECDKLIKFFIAQGVVEGREAMERLIGKLMMEWRLGQQPLQMAKIRPIRGVVEDLIDVFPVMRDRTNFEFFFLTLNDSTFTNQLNNDAKKQVEQFLLDAFTQIYQDTSHQLDALISEWGEGYLEDISEQLVHLQRSGCTAASMFEIKYALEEGVIGKLEQVVRNFVSKYENVKARLEKLQTSLNVDLAPIESRMEELHFFITCSINGPMEMLKENLADLLAIRPKPARAEQAAPKEGKKAGNEPTLEKVSAAASSAPLGATTIAPEQAAPAAAAAASSSSSKSEKAIQVSPPKIAAVVKTATQNAPSAPIKQPAKPAPAAPAAAAAPSSQSEKGPDLSSERSRKLRNFLETVKKYGYFLAGRSNGSHFAYRHRELNSTVSIPHHNVLREGTARSIINEILTARRTQGQQPPS